MHARCNCQCHIWPRGNQRACAQAGRYMTAFDWAQRASVWEYHMDGVDVRDPLEAALACEACLRHHCPALSGRPYPIPGPRIVKRFVREQADGYTDGYEDTGKGSQ
jgi:hypothetical protein